MRTTIKAAVLTSLSAIQVFAAGTGRLPWEDPLHLIAQSLTGPVAFSIGIIGVAAAGGSLLWHGDMGEFGKRGCHVGLTCSVLLMAASMLTNVYGVTGALI